MSTAIGVQRNSKTRLAHVEREVLQLLGCVYDDIRERERAGDSDETLEHVGKELRRIADELADLAALLRVTR